MVSDAELLQQFIDGDEMAFEAIVRRYEHLLRSYARRFFREHDRVQDVCQLVWLQLFLSRPLATERHVSLRPWLITVLQHRCIDELIREKRHALLFSYLSEEEEMFVDSLKDEHPLPEEALEAQQERQRASWAIAQLPPLYREVMWLWTYQHLSHAEIAQKLCCSEHAVKSRIYRARLQLRRLLEQE